MKQKSNTFTLYIIYSILAAGLFTFSHGFGKNKVQYKNLSWHYYTTPHFNTYFHQNQSGLPPITAQWIENAYEELSRDFGFTHKKKIPLLVFASPTLFEQTNVIQEIIPEGVGGFTEMLKNRIVVPFTGNYAEFRHVLHHECVHAFQFAIMFDKMGGALFRAGAMQLPLWFAEGSAEYLSSGWDNEADMFLMDRTINNSIPLPGPEMNDYMVYKGGQSFLFFLASSRGDSTFNRFITSFTKTKQVYESAEHIYKKKIEELGKEWQRELKRIYWPEIGIRENLETKGKVLASHMESRSFFNLKPRLSPDGNLVAYYSDVKDYTKIIITDTKGKVRYKIGQYGYGGYFESFQPFRSGLCWSPKSDRIAFVTKNKGKNEIRIVDVARKKNVATLEPDVASISSPDWSPDGKHIVFCGLKQHTIDLYLMNIETKKTVQLTNDILDESNPRFFRNGESIIFAARDTCGIADRTKNNRRPSSDLYQMDLASKKVTRLTATSWNEDQPCFSPNGNAIAFVSDRNGINNIYIAPLNHPDSAKALTNIIGGCSNPDWALDDNSLVFSLFQNQGWDIWHIEKPNEKVIDSLLPPTLWVKSQADTSIHFFLPAAIVPDSTDSSGITEITETRPSSFKKSTTKNTKTPALNEPVGISEEKNTPASLDSVRVLSADSSDSTLSKQLVSDTALSIGSDSANHTDSLAPDIHGSSIKDTLNDTVTIGKRTDSIPAPILLPKNMPEHPYKLQFSVDVVSVGMAYSTMYGYGGQGAIVFSDLLGNHQIAIAGNMQGSLKENNLFAYYINSQYRIDFGLGGFYEKYYTYATLDYYNLYHDTNIGGMFMISYPFSIFSRVEFNFFYQHLTREPHLYKNGKIRVNDSLPTVTRNVTLPSLSYVFDNILWGITGPINGVRAKTSLLVSPSLQKEDASFLSAESDIRHYWHINRKFVWANRISAGFSEPLKQNGLERRFFLGGNEYWLFYEINRKNYEQNLPNNFYGSIVVPFRGWNYYDLSGTRYAIVNSEFRFPFVKEIDIVWPLPMSIRYINGAIFMDIGNAWDPEDQYENIPLPRNILGGVGFGLRANLGIFILRYDLAWKTDWHQYMKDSQNYWSLGAEF